MPSRPLSRSDGTLFQGPVSRKSDGISRRGDAVLLAWNFANLVHRKTAWPSLDLTVWFRDQKVTRTFKKLTLQASRRDHRGTGHEKPRVSFSLSLFFATSFTIWEPCTTIPIVAQFSVTERPTSFPGFPPTSLGTRFLKDVFKNYKRFLSGEE